MRRTAGTLATVLGLVLAGSSAAAQQAWQAVENQASALLPEPTGRGTIESGRLSCAEQVWVLSLGLSLGGVMPGTAGGATLAIDGETFPASFVGVPGAVEITVPHEAIEPLRAGVRLKIGFSGGEAVTEFALRGSRRAITAAEKFCTPRAMPGLNRIVPMPSSPHLPLARDLRRDDIRGFAEATMNEPKLAAGLIELGTERQLLFVELCGSSWYFGVSGCSLTGYASEPREPEWRLVYESEGVFLYVDPERVSNGWPDLVSVPLKSGFEEKRWIWNGTAYQIDGTGEEIAEGG